MSDINKSLLFDSSSNPQTQQTQPFLFTSEAKTINTALKSWTKDEDSIFKITTSHTFTERQEIKRAYFEVYRKNILDDFLNLNEDYAKCIIRLFQNSEDADCKDLFKAIEGSGTNEDTLIEILCSRNCKSLSNIIERYKFFYNKDLIKEIEGELSGELKSLFVNFLTKVRNDNELINKAPIESIFFVITH